MSRALRILGVTAVLLLVAGLLGLGATTAGADETEPDPALTGAPEVGACYNLTRRQGFEHAAAKAPSSCSTRHTMVVTAVGRLPDSVDWVGFDWDAKFPKALSAAITRTCDPSTDKLFGSPRVRALTLWSEWFFAPTDAQVEAGARWFSCLVALDDSTSFLPIPAGQPKKLTGSVPSAVERCARTVKGGFRTVACTRSHQWRTTYAQYVKGRLTDRNVLKAAQTSCPRHVSTDEWLYSSAYHTATMFILRCSTKTRR